MNQEFEVNIENISKEEKKLREESLNLFNKEGFPNKRLEEWKFTDLNKIIRDNFKELKSSKVLKKNVQVEQIEDFAHNSIILVNGHLEANNFHHEDTSNIKIKKHEPKLIEKTKTNNPLINLNDALFEGGYYLEIGKNYKFKKPLIVYNFFQDNVKNKIFNNKNLIILRNNSSLDLIEFNTDTSRNNFVQNNYTSIKIEEKSCLKSYTLQGCKSNGFYYKFIKSELSKKSNYENLIFSSGLKFNRVEEDVNINGEESNCTIQSALFLDLDSHQEIKTKLNHLKPNCTSYQKIKNVLNKNCKGAYQGKIFVKDIAQKTDAYQLSKALLLSDSSEFNAKPELEIYADDVKCSHGSTSGSMNEDSIYYLMTRGINRKKAIELLTKAFLLEVLDSIKNIEIKKFIEKNLDRQIYGY
ncbi:MAG: Fe-S cluster assembly protein SufD [Pelagibacterales bacterium]|nr:Fe-S cluster assembly protein SufD [Pelagibacterales bacterium]